ncbi:MAG: 4Fe-4S dicluster domain-containing protein [Thermodesulfobacteriota bacterium]
MAIVLKKEKLELLVTETRIDGAIFAGPTMDGGQIMYRPLEVGDELEFDYVVPANSAKEFCFPQTETIADITIGKDTVDLRPAVIDPPLTIIFGTRPCDASAFASLRSVFTWDFIDESYTKREDKALVISIACTKGDESCFCTSIGLTPDGSDGSDILLRETEGGDFVAEAVTDKGKELVEKYTDIFEEGDGGKVKDIFKPEKLTDINLTNIDERLKEKDHYGDPVWAELARKCMGCGACTYSCPTCHCFDITDEGTAFESKRKKNWDACQFDHFTLHAAGHNPRDTQDKRWRNRFMCKFNYYPNKFKTKGCVGCGRCIRVCPVRLDITEAMAAISGQK